MPPREKGASPPKYKQVSWRIPEPLRRRLNSHAEYLCSIDKETDTETMVEGWLKERLKMEERKRALRTLGIEEKDLAKLSQK